MRDFTDKIKGVAAFLKINSFVSIFEEVWPQFQLANFMNTSCSEQLVLHSSGDYDFSR